MTNKHYHTSLLLLCIFFLLLSLISKETFCLEFRYNKRQAVASRSCGDQNNTVGICSPTSTSVWTNNTDQEITWKWNNPKFDQYTLLDLYLLYLNASSVGTTNYQTIKTWPGLEKSKGILVPHIDDSWYPAPPLKENSPNVTYIMYFYIVGAGYDIQSDLDLIPTEHNFFPVPQSFSLVQTPPNTTLSSSPTTSSPSSTTTPNNSTSNNATDSNNNNKLPNWAIAVIVIAALLFILACAALIWAYKRYQKRKQLPLNHNEDEKIPVLTPTKNDSNIQIAGSASVTTPTTPTSGHLLPVTADAAAIAGGASINSNSHQLWSPRSLSPIITTTTANNEMSHTQQHQQQNQLGLNSEANQSSSILSSTDALMIADTFRQFMRKPDWNEELELNEQNKRNAAGSTTTTTIKE